MDKNELKQKVIDTIDHMRDELIEISQYIFHHPELAYEEYKACEKLTSKLKEHGFHVEKGVYDLDTAFIGSYGEKGPKVAFMAEYDALPEIGHACGHNIIGTAAIGAGIGLSKVLGDVEGIVKVIGTPAEENGSGKIEMVEKGAFKDVDFAMLMHPSDISMADDVSFANQVIEYTFHGRPSHAAAFPWEGASALNALIEFFNATNALRLHIKDYGRIHGIITDGGKAPNIIPEKATAIFSIRALENEYVDKLIEKMNKCAEGVAIATETKLEVKYIGPRCKDVRNNKVIVRLIQENFDHLGEYTIQRSLDQGIGSTDVGNVTHEIPAIQSYIGIAKDIKGELATHTAAFAEAAGSKGGDEAVIVAAKTMALTAVDILTSKEIRKEIEDAYHKGMTK